VKISKFEILEKLNDGVNASTFKAYQSDLDRVVLLKVLHPHLRSEPELVARFRREARAGARLDSEAIVHVFDFTESDEVIAIAMEYVEGISLRELLDKQGRIDLPMGLTIASGVLQGLVYAHVRDVIHRDVKPSNILLTANAEVKLTDFGLASILNAPSLTTEGTLLGTPAYMSPEQTRGEKLDYRTDLFSLGVTTFEMLSGVKVFGGSSYAACLHKIQTLIPQPLSELREDIHSSVADWVANLISKKPEDRCSSSEAALAELNRLRSSLGISSSDRELAQLVQSLMSAKAETPTRFRSQKVAAQKATQETVGKSYLGSQVVNVGDSNRAVESVTPQHGVMGTSRFRFAYIGSLIGAALIFAFLFFVNDTKQIFESPGAEPTDVSAIRRDSTSKFESPFVSAEKQDEHSSEGARQKRQDSVYTMTQPSVLRDSEAYAQTASSGIGELEISCVPWAKVYVDGQFVETTPLSKPLALSAGKHVIKFSNPSFSSVTKSVEISPGHLMPMRIDFLANSGFLKMSVRPWAQVFIDNEFRETTPLSTPLVVEAGNRRVSLINPAFRLWEKNVTVLPRDTLSLNVVLEPIQK
jgi:serine/threonine-protein kinase